MVFSDNVPLEQEVALKEYAGRAGLLVMGPDCGTAVVGGVGLGFANVVRPGPVGIVAASGTGAQHLMALLDGAGVGVSHCLGVGGRDLSAEVAGRSTLQALDLLDADASTELIVVVSKPPAAEVAEAVRARASALGTPVLFGLLGAGQPDLTATAASVVQAAGGALGRARALGRRRRRRPARRRAARAVRRRHAVRRGDAGRLGRARTGHLQHPAGPVLGRRRRPRLRRAHDARLRRRPADPRPPAPDDRRRPAGRAAARRDRGPHHGRAAPRRGPRARLGRRPRRRARARPARGPRRRRPRRGRR